MPFSEQTFTINDDVAIGPTEDILQLVVAQRPPEKARCDLKLSNDLPIRFTVL